MTVAQLRRRFTLLGMAVLVAYVSGCQTSVDVTDDPAWHTGYVPGEVYRLEQDVLLARSVGRFFRMIYTLERVPRSREISELDAGVWPNANLGVVKAGTRLKINSLTLTSPDFLHGYAMNTHATILDGDFKQQKVRLGLISDRERRWTEEYGTVTVRVPDEEMMTRLDEDG